MTPSAPATTAHGTQRGTSSGSHAAHVPVLSNFIGGMSVDARPSGTVDVFNPATGEVLAKTPLSTRGDVDAAVAAAKAAFPAWRATPVVERARTCSPSRTASRSTTRSWPGSSRPSTARRWTRRAARPARHRERGGRVRHALAHDGAGLEDIARGIDCDVHRQPMGVFGAIAPFNFPSMVPLWFLPYAIATGNTFVLKPTEQVPLSQRRIFELLEGCVPPGVVNIVNGGGDVVNGLCEHPDIEGVSFVGSTPVARHVYRAGRTRASACRRSAARRTSSSSCPTRTWTSPSASSRNPATAARASAASRARSS